jgi:hypothetical protein
MFINWLATLRWERWHPRAFAWMRSVGGVIRLVGAAVLVGYHVGGWWLPALLVAASALGFYVAYRLPPVIAATNAT